MLSTVNVRTAPGTRTRGVLVLVAGLATSGRWARGTAERTADLLMSEEPRIPVTAP